MTLNRKPRSILLQLRNVQAHAGAKYKYMKAKIRPGESYSRRGSYDYPRKHEPDIYLYAVLLFCTTTLHLLIGYKAQLRIGRQREYANSPLDLFYCYSKITKQNKTKQRKKKTKQNFAEYLFTSTKPRMISMHGLTSTYSSKLGSIVEQVKQDPSP